MADRMFGIDFGSGYTKVALRAGPTDKTQLVRLQTGSSEANFCIPSVVAVDATTGERRYEYGAAAAGRRPAPNLDIYTNWKRWAFEHKGDAAPVGLDALLASEDFASLAGRYQVPLGQVQHLRQLVKTIRGMYGVPAPVGKSVNVRRAEVLAEKFFAFLRQHVLAECVKLGVGGSDVGTIPAVLTVPAFAPDAELAKSPGVQLLLDALKRAGWPLHEARPVISEPYANAIGILSRGANPRHNGYVSYRQMFSEGPLNTAITKKDYYPLYRALVIDIGAYTTDVAAVDLPTDEGGSVLDPDTRFRVAAESFPLGISHLDERLRGELPPDKAKWLEGRTALEWEDVRSTLYSTDKPLRTQEVGQIGRAAEGDLIRDVVSQFGAEILSLVNGHCEALPPGQMQELLLTGGGSKIPAVRAALERSVKIPGRTLVKIHSETARRPTASAPLQARLDKDTTRGGSALGAASIYFER